MKAETNNIDDRDNFVITTGEIFHSKEIFPLESGEYLPEFHIKFNTFGQINKAKDNVIWVIHALTANSNPIEWWPGIVGPNCPIDTNKYHIICANCLGSHYGSTSPLSINPETNEPYYHTFPMVTNRDIVNAFDKLRIHLGLEKIMMITGASLGGQQVLEWIVKCPDLFENAVILATNAKHSPWGIAFNESQRLAIESDQTWKTSSPEAGKHGLKAARSIALLSYRTPSGYNITQEDNEYKLDGFKVQTYQRYQGDKLVKRFNAFSYYALTKAMDSHNLGRGRGSIEKVLGGINIKLTCIGISSDLLFPLIEQKYLVDFIPEAKLIVIDSVLGHDGFLTEHVQVGQIFNTILA